MRVWLRLAAGLMAFFVARNLLAHAPFLPSLASLGFCLLFERWLSRPESATHLEWTALAIGLCASIPTIVHINAYGANADAPPLVVMPSIVLFTALLSRGPATWVTVAVSGGILTWAGSGQTLSLTQSRLLGDLALSFVVLVLALGRVFALRKRLRTSPVGAGAGLGRGIAPAPQARRHALPRREQPPAGARPCMWSWATSPSEVPGGRVVDPPYPAPDHVVQGISAAAPDSKPDLAIGGARALRGTC